MPHTALRYWLCDSIGGGKNRGDGASAIDGKAIVARKRKGACNSAI